MRPLALHRPEFGCQGRRVPHIVKRSFDKNKAATLTGFAWQAQRAELADSGLLDVGPTPALQARAVTSLEALPLHAPALVAALHLEPREATWLRAVGLVEGCSVTVLRKAPWSGPLHVRVADHTELAIDRALALHVEVTPLTGASP